MLFRSHVLRVPPRRILELGLGTLARTERLLGLVRTLRPAEEPHYVGLDRFEGRPSGGPPGVTLKEAHRRLHSLARVQLVPGEFDRSLARLCNHLGTFDLVLVSADDEAPAMDRCWFFIQRIVTRDAAILVESRTSRGRAWAAVTRASVDQLAAATVLRRAG